MVSQIRPAALSFVILTIVTGVIYPLLVTGLAKIAFANEANGSIIVREGSAIGSKLIAQPFTDPKFFWPRPSAASYNGVGGCGSNHGPTNPALKEAVQTRIKALNDADPSNLAPIPVDLVTASGSGLDPHLSVAAARYQIARVARVRGIAARDVEALLADHTEERAFGLLGEPRVNVLLLNLALSATDVGRAGNSNAQTHSGLTVYRHRGFVPDQW